MRLATRIQQNQNRCSVIERGRAAMKMSRRPMLVPLMAVAFALSSTHPAWAEPAPAGPSYQVVPGGIAGNSPDGLGTWTVHYQRIDGGDPDVAAALCDGIDA